MPIYTYIGICSAVINFYQAISMTELNTKIPSLYSAAVTIFAVHHK